MANQGPAQTKRERQRERAEAKRAAERKAQQRRNLGYALGGIALVAVVVVLVVALMGGAESSGTGGGSDGGPSTPGEVTVEGPARETPLQPGDTVPTFSAPGVSGGMVRWDDYLGTPAVLSVWATWCPHCQAEIPLVDQVMREEYPDLGWLTIVTSVGDAPGPEPGEFFQDQGIDPTTAVDDANETLARAFGIVAFPTLYFINSDGTVSVEYEGEIDEGTLRSMVEALA